VVGDQQSFAETVNAYIEKKLADRAALALPAFRLQP